jgi:hypothetical protein
MLRPNNPFTNPPMRRLDEDGNFGPKTKAMVQEFQRLNEVKVDGIVGPVTSYLLMPYITFTAQLAGQGRIRGRSDQAGLKQPLATRQPFTGPARSGTARAKEPVSGGKDEDTAEEKLAFDVGVAPGFKREFKPWFVLKPNGEPEGGKSEATLTVEGTILRDKGIEFGGELEFSRRLAASGGSSWEWEGSLTGTYTNLKTKDGLLSLSPKVEQSIKQGLILGAAVGAEASVQLVNDRLELSVSGKLAGEWDPHNGSAHAGLELSAELKLKWDLTRFIKK